MDKDSSKRGPGLDYSDVVADEHKRAKQQTAVGHPIVVASKEASQILLCLLDSLQSNSSKSKAEAGQVLESALALQDQVNAITNAVVQQERTKLKCTPEDSCLLHEDIWINKILPFVGTGQFAFVAPVSHNMKKLYKEYCETAKNPVVSRRLPCDTVYSAVFCSVSRAGYWYTHQHAGAGGQINGSKVCAMAAKLGSLEVLKWAQNKGFDWNRTTCSNAAKNGHMEILKYAHENACPWDGRTCWLAASNGHLEILKYAHENGCPWDGRTCQAVAENGHLEILKYAHENGCPWNESTCWYAASNGHLEILKYAHENGCPWDDHTCQAAAENGHLEILGYAHENDCPWDEWTCTAAAENGHLEVLKYAHENGCPWDGRACYWPAQSGYLQCLKYAIENGCDWQEDLLKHCSRGCEATRAWVEDFLSSSRMPFKRRSLNRSSGHTSVYASAE